MRWFFSPPFREGLGVGFFILTDDINRTIGRTTIYIDVLDIAVGLRRDRGKGFAQAFGVVLVDCYE